MDSSNKHPDPFVTLFSSPFPDEVDEWFADWKEVIAPDIHWDEQTGEWHLAASRKLHDLLKKMAQNQQTDPSDHMELSSRSSLTSAVTVSA